MQKNIEVDVAESVREAMRLLDRNAERYCCILLDLILPDGDGLQIATRVHEETLRIPVAVVTGYPERQQNERAASAVIVRGGRGTPSEISRSRRCGRSVA